MAHLILVNPAGRERLYQELGNELMAIEPPLWCRLIAGYCRDKGHRVEIIDAEAEQLTPFDVARQIKDKEPDLVGMIVYGHQPNASTQQMEPAGETCSAIKMMCDVPIIIAGGHVTVLPEKTMREEDVNYVALGEGAVTIEQLLSEVNIYEIPGLVWHDIDEGTIVRNPPPPNLDVDQLYGRTWDLLPMDKYRAHNWHCDDGRPRQPYASIYTSLGCPFKCSFCLDEDTKIIVSNGRNKKIKDVTASDKLLAWNLDRSEIVETEIQDISKRVVNEIYEIELEDGKKIKATREHPFLVGHKWVELQDLNVGDALLVIEPSDKVSFRMKHYNPMRNSETRKKTSFTQKKKIANGEITPFMCTDKGRAVISKKAKERADSDANPLRYKNMTEDQKAQDSKRKSQSAKKLWGDTNYREKQKISGNMFLSSGENAPQWRGGISFEDYGPDFNEALKTRIRERDSHECQMCGDKNKQLQVHHIDYDKKNNIECNLITLCVSCHPKTNFNRKTWQKKLSEQMRQYENCPHYVKIKNIKKIEGERTVYNFECGPYDNFFAEYFAVHNCCINAPFGGPGYRVREPLEVVDEVNFLYNKYGITNFKIIDEMFVLKPTHYLPICEGLAELPFANKLNFWAYARVDTVKEEHLPLLRKAGIRWLALGIESGSAHVRDGANKTLSSMDIDDIVKTIQKHDIKVIGNFIFGLPDDTHETMNDTLEVAIDLDCDFVNFYAAQAYPGSKLFEQVDQKDLPTSWAGYAQHSYECKPLPTEHLTSEEVLAFRDYAHCEYFENDPKLGKPLRRLILEQDLYKERTK